MTSERITRPLLAVKRVIPPPRAGAVPRERLESRLREAESRLTLVVAPPGWGKTSLLSGWAVASDRIAWVSLDETDDEPSRFWTYVLTALHETGAVSEAPLRAAETAGISPVELALPMLLNELTAAEQRHVLVLDDYHVLTDGGIHESVEFLLAYLPAALRLVIAGRTDPPLPLARLRARGNLTELRAADLRFSREEAAALVTSVAGTEAAADAAWERTEGWAAGLQLAGLALRHDPARVGGDERHLLDYFAAEVLPSLAPRQRDLLVRTAPLERLSGPLCDAALQVTGSAAILEELSRADLFVAALDAEQEWYRCHPLLRDALSRDPAADRADTLVRAAGWFAAQGRVDDAVGHLHRAGHDTEAADLLLQHAEQRFFATGDSATYLMLGEQVATVSVAAPQFAGGTDAALPAGEGTAPAMALSLATAASLCGRQDRVIHWLDVCEAAITPETTIPGWRSPRAAVLSLRATFGLPDADSAGSVEMAREALDLETPEGNPRVHTSLASALTRHGRLDEGIAILQDRWQRDRSRWAPWVQVQIAGSLAISLVESDRGPECDRILHEIKPKGRRHRTRRAGGHDPRPGLAPDRRRPPPLPARRPGGRRRTAPPGRRLRGVASPPADPGGGPDPPGRRGACLRPPAGSPGGADPSPGHRRRRTGRRLRNPPPGRGAATPGAGCGPDRRTLRGFDRRTDRPRAVHPARPAGHSQPTRNRRGPVPLDQHGQGLQQKPLPKTRRSLPPGSRRGSPHPRPDLTVTLGVD